MPHLLSGQQTKSQLSAQGLNNFLKLLNCCWNSQRMGSWIMFHEGLSSFGCSHCLGPLFGDRGRGMTMGNTAKIIHVTGLNCQVWDFAFPGGKRRGPGRAAQQDPGLCSSWGQEFELVQVQEPPAQDRHFQRVQGLEGMYWGTLPQSPQSSCDTTAATVLEGFLPALWELMLCSSVNVAWPRCWVTQLKPVWVPSEALYLVQLYILDYPHSSLPGFLCFPLDIGRVLLSCTLFTITLENQDPTAHMLR